jgi:hypothetical protein
MGGGDGGQKQYHKTVRRRANNVKRLCGLTPRSAAQPYDIVAAARCHLRTALFCASTISQAL